MNDTQLLDWLSSLRSEATFHPNQNGWTFIPDVMAVDYDSPSGEGTFTGATFREAVQNAFEHRLKAEMANQEAKIAPHLESLDRMTRITGDDLSIIVR